MGTTPPGPTSSATGGPVGPATASGAAPAASSVGELWARVAREWGIDFEPAPTAVVEVLPELQHAVEGVVSRLPDPQQRRWLAALLGALSHHVHAGTLPNPDDERAARDAAGSDERPDHSSAAVVVAVAVVTGPRGVVVGRRRDGIPRWVFPGGRVELGETEAAAAVRECAEETGVAAVAIGEIGRRVHPMTGRLVVYVGCVPADPDAQPIVAAPEELVEVVWVPPGQVGELMPDLYGPVREHLGRHRR